MFRCNKVVAWRNWEEWKETYRMLYSKDVKEIQYGCARVSAWGAKQILPIAVEVTASLLSELHSTSKSEAALSLAIIRFINGVVEPFKNANLSVPISTIGASYGIPEFVVAIRHSATHGRLPTFDFAALGANSALEWLQHNYWEAQLSELASIEQEMHEQLMGFFFNSSNAFEGNSPNILLSFGINELVKLVLNKNQKKQNVSSQFQLKVLELLESVSKRYKYFASGFLAKIAEETAKGNGVAASWLDFFYEKNVTPFDQVALILRWANPVLLGGAVPLSLIEKISSSLENKNSEENDFSTLNLSLEKPIWPTTSIGNMPVINGSLSLTDDEFEFVLPGQDDPKAEAEQAQAQAFRENQQQISQHQQNSNTERVLEIW